MPRFPWSCLPARCPRSRCRAGRVRRWPRCDSSASEWPDGIGMRIASSIARRLSMRWPGRRLMHSARAWSRLEIQSCCSIFCSATSARIARSPSQIADNEEMMRSARPRTTTREVKAAQPGFRRHQRHNRSAGETRRASIGRPERNRPRSAASSPAVAYRPWGSRAMALSTIVSRSRDIARASRARRRRVDAQNLGDEPPAVGLVVALRSVNAS